MKRHGLVLHNSTPELFRRLLRRGIVMTADDRAEERLLFVKSWNEWAEGNHLEPDLRFGRKYLDVIREELQGYASSWANRPEPSPPYPSLLSAASTIPLLRTTNGETPVSRNGEAPVSRSGGTAGTKLGQI